MNKKAKAKIWQIAEQNDLSDVVIGHGVDRIWDLIRDNDDIFSPLDDVCLTVLNDLK